MGKSKMSCSCLKIAICGSDSSKSDHLDRAESKASSDNCRWSFSKRSTSYRMSSNTVISEMPSASHEYNLEAATNDIYAPNNSDVPAKCSVSQWKDETTPTFSSAEVNLKVADTLADNGNGNGNGNANDGDYTVQEFVVIMIQSAIRGYLAKKTLSKLKNVVKLQAAVRGHVVRRQAMGTLRCVHALVKMQALVRSRRAHLSQKGLSIQEKHDEELKTRNQIVNPLGNSGDVVNTTYSSTKNLVANRFARRLLELKPKTKPIHIHCDPSRSEPAWKWLERWMSVSSLDHVQPEKPQLDPDYQKNRAENDPSDSEIGSEGTSKNISESVDLKSGFKEKEMLLEGEENSKSNIANDFEVEACKPTDESCETSTSPTIGDDMEDGYSGLTQETSAKIRKAVDVSPDSLLSHVVTQPSATLQTDITADFDKPEVSTEKSRHTVKSMSSEELGAEDKKIIFGSRQSISPASAVIQSKFEELSSAASSNRSISSSYKDDILEPRLDSPPSWAGCVTKAKENNVTEDLMPCKPRSHIWHSECGTELSTSSLDSPYKPDAEDGESVKETTSVDKGSSDKFNYRNADADKDNPFYASWPGNLPQVENSADPFSTACPTRVEQNPSEQVVSDMHAQVDKGTLQPVASVSPEGSPRSHVTSSRVEQNPSEQVLTDTHTKLDEVTVQHVARSSPEVSPMSHATMPDSHGTPTSQISLNSIRRKSDNNLPYQQYQSQSVGRTSITNQSHDPSVRSSSEHLSKDMKSVKRRNSFDHEPRVSSSGSNPLPNYMQATESARAKAHVNHSPNTSPDVQDGDRNLKKQHSLPGMTGKQRSPRMQRSLSQVQKSAKGTATHSPQTASERRWQR